MSPCSCPRPSDAACRPPSSQFTGSSQLPKGKKAKSEPRRGPRLGAGHSPARPEAQVAPQGARVALGAAPGFQRAPRARLIGHAVGAAQRNRDSARETVPTSGGKQVTRSRPRSHGEPGRGQGHGQGCAGRVMPGPPFRALVCQACPVSRGAWVGAGRGAQGGRGGTGTRPVPPLASEALLPGVPSPSLLLVAAPDSGFGNMGPAHISGQGAPLPPPLPFPAHPGPLLPASLFGGARRGCVPSFLLQGGCCQARVGMWAGVGRP